MAGNPPPTHPGETPAPALPSAPHAQRVGWEIQGPLERVSQPRWGREWPLHGLTFHVCSQTGDQERYFHEQFLFKEAPGRLLQTAFLRRQGKRPTGRLAGQRGTRGAAVSRSLRDIQPSRAIAAQIPSVWDQLDPGWKETSRHLGEGREQAGKTNPQISMLFEPKIMALDSLLQFEDAFK